MLIRSYLRILPAALFGVPAPPHAVQPDTFRIDDGRAGRFEVGMPIDQVYLLFDRKQSRLVDLQLEGEFSPAMEISLPGGSVSPSLVVQFREWPCSVFAISGITVRDPRFRTAEGIGVGSTLREMKRQYSVVLSREEGAHAVVLKKHLTFGLTDDSPADSARVTEIWIPLTDFAGIREKRCPQLGPIGTKRPPPHA